MKLLIFYSLLVVNFIAVYANDQSLTLTLLCDNNLIECNQTVQMSVIIKNTKNLSRHINNTSILNALSHLKFYRIKNDELEELSVGINSTVSKMGFNEKLTIGPLSEIVLSQEILLADTNLFNLVTLSRYTGYALVLEDEGIFMPISGADMEIVIQAKLRYDNYIIESNIIHLKTMFSKTTDKP